ncbi:MAG: hypothetical protein OXE79_03605 [Acidimicrobiaceae bacterium]|nr:hypothetical protein [Acidimicrobiaceae bacterium]MCY4174962.1 hypothetical protein [Acidimicrobiaceae bacterium]MCY4279485.1 hypothetical protein [Acidimicrobiaceae bacterium]MCY4294297.1 hypothetical protein [Acidimicrobiaceae bacterium]
MDLRSWIIGDLLTLRGKLEGGVLKMIPAQQLRQRADGGGIAPSYVLWHLARHHDLAVNGTLRGGGCVVEGWTDRLGVAENLWRGLAEGEDCELTDVLDPEAVGGYALAVFDSTAAWLDEHGLPEMDSRPDTASALQAIGAPEDRFDWLYSMWDGKPAAWFLQWSAVGHGYNHLGELVSIRNRMGFNPF